VTAPLYGTASLADVMPSVLGLLGVPGETDTLALHADLAGVRRVAVLLVDGLGWHQLPLAAPLLPSIRSLPARKLTSGFPSTTPTSLVTLGTGTTPGAHGIVGFTVNVPGTDRVLNHIRWGADPDPQVWQPVPTAFDRAAAAGLRTAVVVNPDFEGSGLTVSAYRGAGFRGAAAADDIAREMLAALAEVPLVYGYFPDVDHAGHVYGVDSTEWRAAVADTDRLVTLLLERLPADAALLVTADHGQLNVAPEDRFDIDATPALRAGLRVIAGEPRVRYLHTLPGARDDVVAAWRAILGPAAWVGTREEAVARGWYGPVPPSHAARLGDVVVACHDRYAILATSTEPALLSRLIAYHGSDTDVEMEIPLLVARGSVVPRR
jgi:Type I phosphodiesterase / nucleotide pyrophosphatase